MEIPISQDKRTNTQNDCAEKLGATAASLRFTGGRIWRRCGKSLAGSLISTEAESFDDPCGIPLIA
jgi:hypothetical protein